MYQLLILYKFKVTFSNFRVLSSFSRKWSIFVLDEEDFEEPVKAVIPKGIAAVTDKWDGEDEDEPIRVCNQI